MFVEHLDVVARVLFRREGIELAADRVDRLRDVLRRSRRRAFEEHVLGEMRDAAFRVAFVPGAARQPHPDRDRAHVLHGLSYETEAGRQGFRYHHSVDTSARGAADALTL